MSDAQGPSPDSAYRFDIHSAYKKSTEGMVGFLWLEGMVEGAE
jgi:hypothetical protein